MLGGANFGVLGLLGFVVQSYRKSSLTGGAER